MSRKSFEIESFMTERLKLSGNDLVLYAIMWKETAKGTKNVPLDYQGWAAMMGASVPTLYSCLDRLVKKGYINQECKTIYGLVPNT